MPVPSNFNVYTHRLGFLCLASQRDGQTKKNKQTNSASQLRGEQTPPRSPNFQGMQRWMHTTYFIQALYGSDPFLRSQGRKKPQNADFAMKQTNICRLSGDIINVIENCENYYKIIIYHYSYNNCEIIAIVNLPPKDSP